MTDLQPMIHLGPLPTGRHALPREAVVRAQRERILRGMASAVAARGYANTRVSDVLERAGVSRRTFYEQFSNKHDCFLAAYDAAVSQATAQVQTAYGEPGPWELRLRAGFAAFLDFLGGEPDFARMCIVEVLAAGGEALARRDRALADFGWMIAQSHRDAPEDHVVLPIYFEVIAGGIYDVIHALIVRGGDPEPDLRALLDDFLYCALAPAGAGREPTAAL
jgi:AcrR family transcriptional regulator